jgi:hypothetical protein
LGSTAKGKNSVIVFVMKKGLKIGRELFQNLVSPFENATSNNFSNLGLCIGRNIITLESRTTTAGIISIFTEHKDI